MSDQRQLEGKPGGPDAWALAEHYDESYYTHNLGAAEPCDAASPHWRRFFDGIANAIVRELAPRTVLDAGCGPGLLVRSLRERGVEAWGIDISEYAIEHVPDSVRDYCSRASVTDELDRDFELIVCIEVVEHLPAELGRQAIENLARHTDSVLFSSTPDDFREATHLNVQSTDYWVESFARCGIFRNFDFDARFIALQAMHLVRRGQTAVTVARQYERAYWRAVKESAELRVARFRDRTVVPPESVMRRLIAKLRRR